MSSITSARPQGRQTTSRAGFVAIAGRPNVGKSTLLNRLLGSDVSIVTPKAQTTRERVLGILSEEKQARQIVFIDTPGIHRAKEGGINAFMVNEARLALDSPSAAWYLVDPTTQLKHEEPVLELLAASKTPVFLVLNKQDLVFGDILKARAEALEASLIQGARSRGFEFAKIFQISARDGRGVKELLETTWGLIPESPFYFPDLDQLSDRPARFFVAEKVREQLLMQLGQELPYSCAVQIEKFDEQAKPVRIEALIHVERESQKGMVVGKGGLKIRAIGTSARRQIEEFLGHPVFLGLKVKVLKDWSKDAEQLRRLGYDVPSKGKRSGS